MLECCDYKPARIAQMNREVLAVKQRYYVCQDATFWTRVKYLFTGKF